MTSEPDTAMSTETAKNDSAPSLLHVTQQPQAPPSHLSYQQLSKVDSAFQEMFGYAWGTTFSIQRSKILSEQEELLVEMLGPTATARILYQTKRQRIGTPSQRRHDKLLQPVKKYQVYKPYRPLRVTAKTTAVTDNNATNAKAAEIASAAVEQILQPKVESSSSKDFSVTATTTATAAASSGGGGGVDQLLQQLSGTNKVSTVAKTSADWDQFKTKTGLGEKLEEQAESKDAFLKKQEFLTRVDHRKFDLEKTERDRARAKRGI